MCILYITDFFFKLTFPAEKRVMKMIFVLDGRVAASVLHVTVTL